MPKLLVSCLLLLAPLACALGARATRQQPEQAGARKVDECGDIQISDWLARADNFAVELQNAPAARGYIVAYGVPNEFPGWPLRRAYHIKGYLMKSRGLEASRVEVVNGGYRDTVLFQLWIVGAGAQLPVAPFDLGAALARERTPLLFDRFFDADDPLGPGVEYSYESYLDLINARFEPLAIALRSDPAARACVIAYASRRDRRGADRQLAARRKRYILTTHALAPARVVALAGGRREVRTVELWIVPPGSPLPKPTPEAAPARRRRHARR